MKPRFDVRDAADINRVLIHLVTRWTLPRVEFCVDALPALASQRAQDRFVRLAGNCNCLIGEVLGSVTLLAGTSMVWVMNQGWGNMALVLVATLYATLLGKGIELAWTRVRLLLVLRGLQRRLDAGDYPEEVAPVRPSEVESAGLANRSLSAQLVTAREGSNAVQDNWVQRPLLPYGPERPRVLLRGTADINRLIFGVVTRWTLPRIEIHIDGLPALEAQRAQDRFVRLSDGYSFMLAGLMVTLSLLGGFFHIVWTSSQDLAWTPSEGWRDVGLVAVVALYAGLLGGAIEVVWIRVKLLAVLRRLRRRAG